MDDRSARDEERTRRIDAGSALIVAMGVLMALQTIWFVGS